MAAVFRDCEVGEMHMRISLGEIKGGGFCGEGKGAGGGE